jgi:hypothetical protein
VIIVYNKETNKIVLQGDFDPAANTPEGCGYVELPDGNYFDHVFDPETGTLVPDPELVAERLWRQVRQSRDAALTRTDYLVMPDYPITDEDRVAVVAFRQALRDLTKQADPAKLVWPEMPVIGKDA